MGWPQGRDWLRPSLATRYHLVGWDENSVYFLAESLASKARSGHALPWMRQWYSAPLAETVAPNFRSPRATCNRSDECPTWWAASNPGGRVGRTPVELWGWVKLLENGLGEMEKHIGMMSKSSNCWLYPIIFHRQNKHYTLKHREKSNSGLSPFFLSFLLAKARLSDNFPCFCACILICTLDLPIGWVNCPQINGGFLQTPSPHPWQPLASLESHTIPQTSWGKYPLCLPIIYIYI